MAKTYLGYLLIADISGYTVYLKESELEHAQETLTRLLEVLVDHTRPPLVISRLEGDAVISYGLAENFFQSQTVIEVIEDIYVAFRRAIELMVLNNTCSCKACANVSILDLKLFLHYGSFGIQRIADYDELVGNEVNLLHRLLKNSVREATGINAYALYTETALRQLGLSGLKRDMKPYRESYEHLGEIKIWVQDMHAVWEKKRQTTIITIPQDQVSMKFAVEVVMPPEQLWVYVTDPKFRNIVIGADKMEISNQDGGFVVPGSVYQCYHGDQLVPHTILEWRPFDRIITQEVFPMLRTTSYMREFRLDPTEGGTRLTMTLSKGIGPMLGRSMLWIMGILTRRMFESLLESLKEQIEYDFRTRQVVLEDELQVNEDLIREAASKSLAELPTSSSST